MTGATFVAVAVGIVVLVISFGFVAWASKDDVGQKDQGQKGHGQKGRVIIPPHVTGRGQESQGQKKVAAGGPGGQKNY